MVSTDFLVSILFVIGLFPMYINYLHVEIHYTNFWTAFWNLYFVAITLLAASLASNTIMPSVVGFLIIAFLVITLNENIDSKRGTYTKNYRKQVSFYFYETVRVDFSNAVRTVGSSLICSSFGVFAFFWGHSGSIEIGLLCGLLNFVALVIIGFGIKDLEKVLRLILN